MLLYPPTQVENQSRQNRLTDIVCFVYFDKIKIYFIKCGISHRPRSIAYRRSPTLRRFETARLESDAKLSVIVALRCFIDAELLWQHAKISLWSCTWSVDHGRRHGVGRVGKRPPWKKSGWAWPTLEILAGTENFLAIVCQWKYSGEQFMCMLQCYFNVVNSSQ